MKPASKNLKLLRQRHGLSQAEFAKKVGVTSSLITQIEIEKRTLTQKTANKIADAFNIDPEVLFEEEFTIPIKADPYRKQYAECYLVETEALASIPTVYTSSSNNIVGEFRIPGLKQREKPYLAIKVQGPSMEPTIRQGDILVIDKLESKSQFIDDKIYVIVIEGMALVKRVRIVVDEKELKIRLISDNGNRHQDISYEKVDQIYKTVFVIKDFV